MISDGKRGNSMIKFQGIQRLPSNIKVTKRLCLKHYTSITGDEVWKIKEVLQMCIEGVIKDSYTLAAIFRAIPHFNLDKN